MGVVSALPWGFVDMKVRGDARLEALCKLRVSNALQTKRRSGRGSQAKERQRCVVTVPETSGGSREAEARTGGEAGAGLPLRQAWQTQRMATGGCSWVLSEHV